MELHPEKTKILYRKDYCRKGKLPISKMTQKLETEFIKIIESHILPGNTLRIFYIGL